MKGLALAIAALFLTGCASFALETGPGISGGIKGCLVPPSQYDIFPDKSLCAKAKIGLVPDSERDNF